ncbi:MAG: hypothetical protein WBS24_03225 [Terriglobales bacterium]
MALSLKPYLVKYHDAGPRYYNKTYDFAKIEEALVPVRAGRERLKPEHVLDIFDADKTPFAMYWPRPNKDDLDKLAANPLLLNLSSQDRADRLALVQKLLKVFYDIGVISIILRFVHPDRFGVISPPVCHLLQVTDISTVDLYLTYCDELMEWKSHFHLSSVAEAEMAILMVAEAIKGADGKAEAAKAKRGFDEDVWVQRQRVAQVVRPFLRSFGRLELARILVNEGAKLAGMIAGEEYERRLRFASQRFCKRELTREKGAARRLLGDLESLTIITTDQRNALDLAWEIRNKAVHPSGPAPTSIEVERMIDTINEICVDWKPK